MWFIVKNIDFVLENSVAVIWAMTFEGFSIWSYVEHMQADDLVHNTRTDLG